MQMIVYLPLTSVKYPILTNAVYGALREVITFDMLPTGEWFPWIFDLPITEAISPYFEDFGLDGAIFISNMGTLFVVGQVLFL